MCVVVAEPSYRAAGLRVLAVKAGSNGGYVFQGCVVECLIQHAHPVSALDRARIFVGLDGSDHMKGTRRRSIFTITFGHRGDVTTTTRLAEMHRGLLVVAPRGIAFRFSSESVGLGPDEVFVVAHLSSESIAQVRAPGKH